MKSVLRRLSYLLGDQNIRWQLCRIGLHRWRDLGRFSRCVHCHKMKRNDPPSNPPAWGW